MKHLKAIIVILFLLLVVILAVQNYQSLSTQISFRANLGFFEWESSGMSVFLIAILTFVVGVICIWLYGIGERLSYRRQIKTLTRDVRDKEKELNSLRNLPVTTDDMASEHASSISE